MKSIIGSEGFKRLFPLLKIGLASGLVFWLWKSGRLDLAALAEVAKNPGLLLACTGLLFFQIFLNNLRWVLLLRAQGLPASVWQTLQLTLVGIFFNFVMPGAIGGDVVKGIYLVRGVENGKLSAASSVMMDRIVGLSSMVFFAVLAVVLNWTTMISHPQLKILAFFLGGLFLAMIVVYSVFWSLPIDRIPRFKGLLLRIPGGEFFVRLYEIFFSYGQKKSVLALGMLLSLVGQLGLILMFYLVAQATGVSGVTFAIMLFVIPLGLIVTAVPLAPGGVGVGQAAFYFLFTLMLGYKTAFGSNVVTLFQILSLLMGAVGALTFWSGGRFKREKLVAEKIGA